MRKLFLEKKNKVNIIPLIDIIFLMLVFFMLATNFKDEKQVSFSSNMIKQSINQSNAKSILIIKIKNGTYEIFNKTLSVQQIEDRYLMDWDSDKFQKIVILNDNKSEFQLLINILDTIKKYKIENVNFSDEPK